MLASPLIHALDRADLTGAPNWGLNLLTSGLLALMALAILLSIGVSDKVQAVVCFALTTVPMACRIMLLTLGVAVLFPFPRFNLL